MSSHAHDEKMNKAQRLNVAGIVAPFVRDGAEATEGRRVALVRDGEVVGYTTLAAVQKSLLKRYAIEIDVQPGTRPKEGVCTKCGAPFRIPRKGRIATRCKSCLRGACVDCGKPGPHPSTAAPSQRRNGAPYRCRSCASKHKTLPPTICADCGVEIHRYASRCGSCSAKSRRTLPPIACVDCGKAGDRRAGKPSAVAKRNGAPYRCVHCSAKHMWKSRGVMCACVTCGVATRIMGATPLCPKCRARQRAREHYAAIKAKSKTSKKKTKKNRRK